MTNLKRLLGAFLFVGALAVTSCSKDAVADLDKPEAIQPLPPSVELPMYPEMEKDPHN